MLVISFNSVLIIAGISVAVPVLLGLLPRLPVPGAVLEVIAGIVVGPSVLGWARVDAPLAVRGLPALLYRRSVGLRRAATAGLLQATTLTFVIVATEIGLAAGKLTPTVATALVAAGLLSAALFPAGAARLLFRAGLAPVAVAVPSDDPGPEGAATRT